MKVIYVKTTETCNLNCNHCFTNGKNGRRIFFDPVQTAAFVNNFANEKMHIDYHGGEPFLAPLADLKLFHKLVSAEATNTTFGATSNLTFKLTKDIQDFIHNELSMRVATSWDAGIRWTNNRQYALWQKNVRTLIATGVTVKVFISINKTIVAMDPKEILDMLRELGIKEVAFERLTHDGSATRNPDIFPTNKEIDDWIWELHEANDRSWFDNTLLESIYAKFEKGSRRESTFCRSCEKFIFTINADGRVAGCPNSAPTKHYAHITDEIKSVVSHENRICMVAEEAYIHPECIDCSLFGICGGDCYKLTWDTQCPAPKRLMYGLNHKTNRIL